MTRILVGLLILTLADACLAETSSQRIRAAAPLTLSGGLLSCPTAGSSQAGCLSSSHWSLFNAKQPALPGGTNGQLLTWQGSSWTAADPPAGAEWGTITGTLLDQIDLGVALDLKAPKDSPVFTTDITVPTLLKGTDAASSPSSVTIRAGDASAGYGADTTIRAGDGDTDNGGGYMTVRGGNGGYGADAYVKGGNGSQYDAGGAYISGGQAFTSGNGGEAGLTGGQSTSGNGGNVRIEPGTSTSGTPGVVKMGNVAQQIIHYRTVSTTDATTTLLHAVSLGGTMVMLIEARITASRSGGDAGADGDSATYVIRARAKRVAFVGVTLYDIVKESSEDQSAWNAALVVSGDTVEVRVTGAVDNNVTWHTTTITQRTPTS